MRSTWRRGASSVNVTASAALHSLHTLRKYARHFSLYATNSALACSACSAEQGPSQKGPTQARECRTAARHFLAGEGLFVACYDV